MNRLGRPSILYSEEIAHVKQQAQPCQPDVIDPEDYQEVVPRVFPDPRVPIKVAIHRRIKQYSSVDLDGALGAVDWHEGEGELALSNYVFAAGFVAEYGCEQDQIARGRVRGRGYCSRTRLYERFTVKSYDIQGNTFCGIFAGEQQTSEISTIHRAQLCLDFEDPLAYITQVQRGVERRNKVLAILQYQFYVDCMDLEDVEPPAHRMLENIKQKAMVHVDQRSVSWSFEDVINIVNRYKRTMNEIYFRFEVRRQELGIYVPTKYVKKREEKRPKIKALKVKKDDKIFKILPKSTKNRLETLKTKTLFTNTHICEIILFLNQKFTLKPPAHLFLPLRDTVVEKYLIKQQRSFGYCFSALNEFIVDPVASLVRALVTEHSEGWFRLYQDNRPMYLESKLRRMFVMVNNMLRDWVVGELTRGLAQFHQLLQRQSAESRCVVVVELVLDRGKVRLSHSADRVNMLLKKMVQVCMQTFTKIPSPEPIVLKQLFGGYRNQQGIKIQLPTFDDSENFSSYQIYPEIREHIVKIFEAIDRITEPLFNYEVQLQQASANLNLTPGNPQHLSEVIDALSSIHRTQQNLHQKFEGCCKNLGFFSINYQHFKVQAMELIENFKLFCRRIIMVENHRLSLTYQQKVRRLEVQLLTKPGNIEELIGKQQLMKNLRQELESQVFAELKKARGLCAEFMCKLQFQDLKTEIQTEKTIMRMFQKEPEVRKEYDQIRRDEIQQMLLVKADIQENLTLLSITRESLNVLKDISEQLADEQIQKVLHIRKVLDTCKKQAALIIRKQALLGIENSNSKMMDILHFEKGFEGYEHLWSSADNWKNIHHVWMDQPVGSFQLREPELLMKNLIADLRKSTFIFESSQQIQLLEAANRLKEEVQNFTPQLQLLRLLKKKGLTRKHLEQICIMIPTEVQNLTLRQAIELGLLERLSQIETISNDAWNQFSLEQTLDRLMGEIHALRFEVSSYKDRKNNDILIITNYGQLLEEADSILVNVESVQFNPMVGLYEGAIKAIYEKINYISKSVNICEQFQKLLVELHPVFDSTDIVKQIPAENKKFAKVLRIWLELLQYVRSVRSVHDSCLGQNIYQKVRNVLSNIEAVRSELINYLELKRRGFSRFYLLSNSEMFELFSATSDINSVNTLIPKLFDSVVSLQLSRREIVGVEARNECRLVLGQGIQYLGINIENWLDTLQRHIKLTISQKIEESLAHLLAAEQPDWVSIVQSEGALPQICYLLYEIVATQQISQSLGSGLDKFSTESRRLLTRLVQRKRKQPSVPLSKKSNLLLCSLIILVSSKIQVVQRLQKLGVSDCENFEWKKVTKLRFVGETEQNPSHVEIQSLSFSIRYGREFLGDFSRLVVTDLTEKMQVVYFLAQKYSLGIAAVGPAGTGKSETTKDISKMIGKTCLIYNCSENFDHSTFLRLMKGLAITGLWMCFDEFNRLDPKLLRTVSEQLSYLLRFRGYGHSIDLNFMGEPIKLEPSFQFCATYNPTYQGRHTIPKNLRELFRTVAVVSPDELAICQALLFSSGYSRGESLALNIVRVLKTSRDIWDKKEEYDFGLRALRSIVNLGTKFLLSGKQDEQGSIFEALKILNLPKMTKKDCQIFIKIICRQFERATVNSVQALGLQSRVGEFNSILSIRDGILLCGQGLSGKQTTLSRFQAELPEWQVEQLFHDVLEIDQIYGQLDPATKLWRDGLFAALVRANVSAGESRSKLAIVMNGSVYSQWIENLNSFLDSTRKLSLSSGEVISVPATLKIVVSCGDLRKASPATLTRFGIINCQPIRPSEFRQKYQRLPDKIIHFFEEVQKQVNLHCLVKIPDRFVLNWVVCSLSQHPAFTLDNFIYYLTHIYDGLLTEAGRTVYEKVCRRYLSVPYSPFDLVIKINGEVASLKAQFRKSLKYEESNNSYGFVEKNAPKFEEVFIPTLRSFRLTHIIHNFFTRSEGKKVIPILFIVGEHNIGKTKIFEQYVKGLPREKHQGLQIFFTRKTNCKAMHRQICPSLVQKSSCKLGSDPGRRISIWIEDANMPTANPHGVTTTIEMLRVMAAESVWYNYAALAKEHLEDLLVVADAHVSDLQFKNPLNMDPRFYRHFQPVFCAPVGLEEVTAIFKGLIQVGIADQKNSQSILSGGAGSNLLDLVGKSVQLFWLIKSREIYDQNLIPFTLNDLYRTVKGLLVWSLPSEASLICEVFEYEISRNLMSKISSERAKNDLIAQFRSLQKLSTQGQKCHSLSLPLFHNLENYNISNSKCQKIEDLPETASKFQYLCDQYIAVNKQTTPIIVFPEMLEHLIKVYRTLHLDNSHCIIAGLTKCGKSTIVKLASYLISSDLHTVDAMTGDEVKDWHECVRSVTKSCYKNRNVALLVLDNRHMCLPQCTEDVNRLLNLMYVPELYSEADEEEIIYMMQNELVRKNLPVNRNSMKAEFTKYLREKLHLVLLMNPSFDNFKGILSHYPSLVKFCTCFYIPKWPDEALHLVARLEMSDFGHQLDFLPQIHEYCQKICQNSRISILPFTWESMYFNFVSFLRKIYQQNLEQFTLRKNQYVKSQKVISDTQHQLEKTKQKIKKLQPAIIMIENETAKTVRNLQIQRKNAEETNKTLLVKNEEVEKIINQSRKLKAELEERVKIVDIKLKKAWENVSLIKPTHIAEIKTLANPSEFIKIVLAALVILTHEGPLVKEMSSINGNITVEQSYFETAKKVVLSKDSKNICRMLIEFKRQNVSKQMFEKLEEKCLSYKRWSEKQAKTANKAIYYFFLWVDAVANQYRIYQQTRPLREELQHTTTTLNSKQIQINTIRKELQLYQQRIAEYESQHRQKKQALNEYRVQIRKFERMLSRGHELLSEITGEKQKWSNYIASIEQKISHNFGDSIVISATVFYLSPHVYEIRKKIKHHIYKLCAKKGIKCSVTGQGYCEIPWYLGKDEAQTYQLLQIHENEYVIDNIKVAQFAHQTALLLDPEEQGIRLIKQLNWHQLQVPIDKISEHSPKLIKYVESAALYGRMLLIEIDPYHYNRALSFIIQPTITHNKQQRELVSLDKSVPLHDNFRVVLYTTCYSDRRYSMELLSNVQVINYKMTSRQLEQRILETIISNQMPLVKAKIEELARVNNKDMLALNSIEDRLLSTFANELSVEAILESDEIINTVRHSNRLYRQIEERVQESQQQQAEIEREKEPYRQTCFQTCSMYSNMQRLKLVSPLYSYSYYWFLDLFQGNMHEFNLTLYREVAKALKSEQKIVVAILIAEVLFPKLPWKCLFGVTEVKGIMTSNNTEMEDEGEGGDIRQSNVEISVDRIRESENSQDYAKVLGISDNKMEKIMARMQAVRKYLPQVESLFAQQPELFINLMEFPESQILEALPNHFSQLDFFHRILLVSCFRPQCIVELLREWIRVNMGGGFTEANPKPSTLTQNSKPYRPIIALAPAGQPASLEKVKQIYKQTYKRPDAAIVTSSPTLGEVESFETLLKSCIVQNQWLVLENLGRDMTTWVREYFENVIVQSDKEFRLWIVLGDDDIQQRIAQFCDKVRLSEETRMYTSITRSFLKFAEELDEAEELFDRSKRKMLISQMSIFHHLMCEFNNWYSKLCPSPILTLTEWDLKLVIQEMKSHKITASIREILHKELINVFSYGSSVSTYFLRRMLECNSQEIAQDIVVERAMLWLSIWGDDKFPKDGDEYEHEMKVIVAKRNYMESFGLDHRVMEQVKKYEYSLICKFYQKTVFSEAVNIRGIIVGKMEAILDMLDDLRCGKVQDQLQQQLQKIEKSSRLVMRNRAVYHFCRLQFDACMQAYDRVVSDINSCMSGIRQENLVEENSPMHRFMLAVHSGLSPWTNSHHDIKIDTYCQELLRQISCIKLFLQDFDKIGNITDCLMIGNWKHYLQVLKQLWGLQAEANKTAGKAELRLIFVACGDETDLVEQLMKLGFGQPNQQYPEEIIFDEYGKKRELATVYRTDIRNRKIWEIQTDKLKTKGVMGYALLQNLYLHNCQTQPHQNLIALKVQKPPRIEQPNLMKSVLNLSMGLRATTTLKAPKLNNRSGLNMMESQLRGLLLIAGQEDDACELVQKLDVGKGWRLAPVPVYEHGLVDIGRDCEPVATFYVPVEGRTEGSIEGQIARKNVHFSLRL